MGSGDAVMKMKLLAMNIQQYSTTLTLDSDSKATFGTKSIVIGRHIIDVVNTRDQQLTWCVRFVQLLDLGFSLKGGFNPVHRPGRFLTFQLHVERVRTVDDLRRSSF